ncbi:MAG: hypothetical protein ACI8PW_001697 [Methylophilaceae bacterium]|jgi:hypothetical protein
MPKTERRKTLSYEMALEGLAKNVCPGCERQVDLKNTENDFCPYYGSDLHDYFGSCNGRKSVFSQFCH